ncbi:MAG TPA: protein kinase [Gemmataceae bacterium]|jgi:serine/threonine protein kinase
MTEREIFLAALEKDDPTERVAYLDEACGADPPLRQRIESLLRSHERAANFMDVPVVEQLAGDGGGLDFLAPSQKPGSLGRLGHYEVLEVVGRGGMGMVFRAFDDKLQRVVAIKALAPQLATSSAARRRFVREAQAAAAVTHDNVIDIHAVEDAGPAPYLVMQFIDGPTLQQKLDRSGQLPLQQILRIGLQIAEGLAAAHRHGLVHRDVKPANILLENGIERVKLTDFGLARAGDDASLTQSGVVAGTPMYMSPEQAQGEPMDFRSDLFSLGSVLYTMCIGRPPFRAPSAVAVLKRVCEETPRPIREINPELPPWLEELVARLHAKAPADRFASAQEVAELLARRLAELQQGGTPSLPAPRPSAELPREKPAPTPPSRPRRLRVLAVAVVLALLAGLGLSEATGLTNVRGTVIRLFSGEGTLVVEVDDPSVSVSLDGEELAIRGAGVREIRLKPGQYKVKATKEGKLLRQELVTVTKDDRQVVRIRREPASAQVDAADAAAWERRVAALPAEEQVKAVAARLKELNPGFDGKVTHSITGDVVSELQFSTDQVTNILPVRALTKLTSLNVAGEPGKLADLSPLKGLPLSRLICSKTQVSDLSPLKGMPLKWLDCGVTKVSDVTPLKGMPLQGLFCQCPQVSDLTPLRGMQLEWLDVRTSGVTDLSPLQGMPLKDLGLNGTTKLKDLSPLKGMSLEILNLGGSAATDLSPLREMTVKQLWLNYWPERDAEVLRSIKGLVRINGKPSGEFWKAEKK